jgi:hypothetical protein
VVGLDVRLEHRNDRRPDLSRCGRVVVDQIHVRIDDGKLPV